jgi:hypothetical protein
MDFYTTERIGFVKKTAAQRRKRRRHIKIPFWEGSAIIKNKKRTAELQKSQKKIAMPWTRAGSVDII